MKLYATTTSERASKGQGGNELVIHINDENKKTVASINVLPRDKKYLNNTVRIFIHALIQDATVISEYVPRGSNLHDNIETKGEKKKSECDCKGYRHESYCPLG